MGRVPCCSWEAWGLEGCNIQIEASARKHRILVNSLLQGRPKSFHLELPIVAWFRSWPLRINVGVVLIPPPPEVVLRGGLLGPGLGGGVGLVNLWPCLGFVVGKSCSPRTAELLSRGAFSRKPCFWEPQPGGSLLIPAHLLFRPGGFVRDTRAGFVKWLRLYKVLVRQRPQE